MTAPIFERHPIPAVGAHAIVTIPIHLILPQPASEYLAAGILALIGGVFLGFAVVDGRVGGIVLEGLMAIGFAVFC